jgi:hypothetical protein
MNEIMDKPFQPVLIDVANITHPLALERYESRAWMVDDLFDNAPFYIAGTVLECASGNGMIALPLKARGMKVITNEIDPRIEADLHFDACDPNADFTCVDWCITNPPFSLATPILINMMPRVRLGVIFQLRVTFSEPTIERDELFRRYNPNGQITLQRFSFTRNGSSDSATTAWFVWLMGNPPLYAGATGYQVFSKRSEFFKIARRHDGR